MEQPCFLSVCWNVVEQFGLVTLDQTAGDDDALALPGLLQLQRVTNLLERLVLRRFQKPAGVDDDRIGAGGVGRDGQAILGQQAEHALGVDKVLRTAQADEGNGPDRVLALGHRKSGLRADGPTRYSVHALKNRRRSRPSTLTGTIRSTFGPVECYGRNLK